MRKPCTEFFEGPKPSLPCASDSRPLGETPVMRYVMRRTITGSAAPQKNPFVLAAAGAPI